MITGPSRKRPLRVAVLADESEQIAGTFLTQNLVRLRRRNIELAVLVLDQAADRRDRRAYLLKLARRQARVAGCSTATALARILFYERLVPSGSPADIEPAGVPIVRVATLNTPDASDAVREAGADIVCLMGARFLTGKTLARLGVPVFNIHSSDPRWVRGGPVVVWEVLAGRAEIRLAVHEVTEVLDAGAIRAEDAQEVLYRGGLGATTAATMAAARAKVADLFERVIEQEASGYRSRIAFKPGELRVTPPMHEALRAELLCRARTRLTRRRRARLALE